MDGEIMKNTHYLAITNQFNLIIQPLLCRLWGNVNAQFIWEFGNLPRDA